MVKEDQEAKEVYIAALEEAPKRAIEESEREEITRWPSLAHALVESAAGGVTNMPPSPPAPPAPEPVEEPWPLLGQSWSWTSTLPLYIMHAYVDGHDRLEDRVVGC